MAAQYTIDPLTGRLISPTATPGLNPMTGLPTTLQTPVTGPSGASQGAPMAGSVTGPSVGFGAPSGQPTGSQGPSTSAIGPAGNNGGVDIGAAGRIGLGAASALGGPVGLAAGAAGLGLRGYNTAQTDDALGRSGLPSLGFGQTIGSILGLNNYGDGSNAGLAAAIAAQGGNTQSAGSPGFSISAASGADVGSTAAAVAGQQGNGSGS